MSLRSKIILLFVILAIAPMMALAGFGYWQTQQLLIGAGQEQLYETASALSRELNEKEAQIRRSLTEMVEGPEFSSVMAGGVRQEELSALLGPTLNSAEYLEVTAASGSTDYVMGSRPETPVLTLDLATTYLVEFVTEIPGGESGRVLRAGFWASELLPKRHLSPQQSLVLLDASRGTVFFSSGSKAPGAGEPVKSAPSFANALSSGINASPKFKYRHDGEWHLGASAHDPGSRWIVAAISGPGAAWAALDRLVRAYWVFVLGLAVFTGLAFSVLLGRVTKSLRELAKAAEHIGTGELAPWVPLSTTGEVGQLSLAFNRMLERVREMMDQVDQSGRMAVVGQLSAYFAHEIRNPLTSVKLNLQRIERWTRQGRVPEICREPIEISLREVERLTSSVSDVLQLSRAQDSPRDVFGVHGQVEEAAHLLLARFREQGVALTLDLDAEADLILARPGQVKSVILNLMINALEAQPEGGFLEIRSGLTNSKRLGGPAVTVRFRDGGPGVPPEVRHRIFEPFFTTKSNGSGIGLAVANRAVQDNHGRLYVEAFPAPGAGAEFIMTFPLAPIEPDALPVAAGLRRALAQKPGTGVDETPVGTEFDFGPPEIPAHLMTREGLEAVMALSVPDSEEVN